MPPESPDPPLEPPLLAGGCGGLLSGERRCALAGGPVSSLSALVDQPPQIALHAVEQLLTVAQLGLDRGLVGAGLGEQLGGGVLLLAKRGLPA